MDKENGTRKVATERVQMGKLRGKKKEKKGKSHWGNNNSGEIGD
jgi:hypothetical protein